MNYHLTRDVQLIRTLNLVANNDADQTGSFHRLHYQEAYTKVVLVNAWLF